MSNGESLALDQASAFRRAAEGLEKQKFDGKEETAVILERR
jgi:hypothetical protein